MQRISNRQKKWKKKNKVGGLTLTDLGDYKATFIKTKYHWYKEDIYINATEYRVQRQRHRYRVNWFLIKVSKNSVEKDSLFKQIMLEQL